MAVVGGLEIFVPAVASLRSMTNRLSFWAERFGIASHANHLHVLRPSDVRRELVSAHVFLPGASDVLTRPNAAMLPGLLEQHSRLSATRPE